MVFLGTSTKISCCISGQGPCRSSSETPYKPQLSSWGSFSQDSPGRSSLPLGVTFSFKPWLLKMQSPDQKHQCHWRALNKCGSRSWPDGLRGKVLAAQDWGPEFDPPESVCWRERNNCLKPSFITLAYQHTQTQTHKNKCINKFLKNKCRSRNSGTLRALKTQRIKQKDQEFERKRKRKERQTDRAREREKEYLSPTLRHTW